MQKDRLKFLKKPQKIMVDFFLNMDKTMSVETAIKIVTGKRIKGYKRKQYF